ncbi:hypothetical protein [Lacinutrix undariae]
MSEISKTINRHKSSLLQSKKDFEGIYFSSGNRLQVDDKFKELINKVNILDENLGDINIEEGDYFLGFMSDNKGCLLNESGITTFVYFEESEGLKEKALGSWFGWFDFDKIVLDIDRSSGLALKLILNYNIYEPSEEPESYIRSSGIFGTNNDRALKKIQVLLNDIIKNETVLIQHSIYFNMCLEEEYYEDLLIVLEKYKTKYYDKFYIIFLNYYWYKIRALYTLSKFKEASKVLDAYFAYCDRNNRDYDGDLIELKNKVNNELIFNDDEFKIEL